MGVVCLQLVDAVVRQYCRVFPELLTAREAIHACIVDEETSFSRTLMKGIDRFKKQAEAMKREGKTEVSNVSWGSVLCFLRHMFLVRETFL
jgi:alanyl-tRNA synthetase